MVGHPCVVWIKGSQRHVRGVVAGLQTASCFSAMLGNIAHLSATIPGADMNDLQALIMELRLTTGLAKTIPSAAFGASNIGSNGTLAARAKSPHFGIHWRQLENFTSLPLCRLSRATSLQDMMSRIRPSYRSAS